jgi:hypothetical protein
MLAVGFLAATADDDLDGSVCLLDLLRVGLDGFVSLLDDLRDFVFSRFRRQSAPGPGRIRDPACDRAPLFILLVPWPRVCGRF